MGLRMSESAKPYFAMICLQFGYAGMNLVTKTVLDRGMSHYVLVAYRNAFATAAIAPFAFLSERKVRSKMTFSIFMHIFVLALLGPVIDQNLYYIGLKLTSPTFSTAVSNIVPAITFILATLFRISESAKPYFAMICLQFGYAGMNLVTKTVLDRGMSHYVLVAYRNAFATAAIAPFAFLWERKVRSKMTFSIFMHIFVLALLGPVIDQNLYYIGLKLTSPTFSTAVSNIVPAITFILATLFR
ncbi:hypothetical protein F2Q69_00017797 [Brassica cretica]|uniref:WAT1-related protein n=1 Tax=Brassica cretica TaxID=69181 RepID=A0A8S9R6Q7_BRACR|nr:hypothetical protein F2Q69_00017797 [Brassica cretica]